MTKDDLISLLRIDAGWNDALDDYVQRLEALSFGKDTIHSFSVFIKSAKK